MAQHDYDIANQSGANFRADLNNALDAIVSNNSGSSEPSTTFAYEWWIDTSANVLKLRNSANNAWITLPLSITADNSTSGALTVNGNLSTTGTLDVNGGEVILDADADTSITADTDDQIDFRVGAVDVMTLTNSHLVLKGTTPKITIGDGGEEDTALIFDGNAQDFYIGLDDSADDLIIGKGSTVGTTGAIAVDSDQKIGLNGLSAGDYWSTSNQLVLGNTASGANGGMSIATANDATGQIYFADGTSGDARYRGQIQYTHTSDAMDFATAASFAMRIDSSGNVGIGTSSPASKLHIFDGGSSVNNQITFGNPSAVHNAIIHHTSAGSEFLNIECKGTTSGFGNIVFKTGSTPDERMRIGSSGDFLVGKTSATQSSAGFQISGSNYHNVTSTNSGTGSSTFMVHDGSGLNFYVNFTGQVFYRVGLSNLSDQRLKENVVILDKGLDDILKIKPRRFDWIEGEGEKNQIGFIAQEIEEAGLEELVSHYKGASLDDAKGVNQVGLIPILVKGMQEQQNLIENLQQQINEVKNGN